MWLFDGNDINSSVNNDSNNNDSNGLNWGMNGIGGAVASVGGLGLGVLSYLDSHKVNSKNLKIMDQQIAANNTAALRAKENYEGLHNNWGQVVPAASGLSQQPTTSAVPTKPDVVPSSSHKQV